MWDDDRWSEPLPAREAVESPSAVDLTYDDFAVERSLGATTTTTEVHEARVVGTAGPDRVALKQPSLSGTVTRATVERFLEEAEVWARLDDHPHVVGIVDHGTEPHPWIAMEYMDDGSLADRDVDGVEDALWVALGVVRAVRHAHTQGVVHHDLKPGNVLFRTVPGATRAVPKVADWELARQLLDATELPEEYTPRYAAPEQLQPETYGSPDNRTDVFQLGVLCYELFTGNHPFAAGETAATATALADGPTPPTEHDPDLPPAVDSLVLTALEPDPADRHEDVLDLRRGLERLADAWGADVESRPDEAASASDDQEPSTATEQASDDQEPSPATAPGTLEPGADEPMASAPEPDEPAGAVTVRFATLRDEADATAVRSALIDDAAVVASVAGGGDAEADALAGQVRRTVAAIDGDIAQWGDATLVATPTGRAIARSRLTEREGDDTAWFEVAEVESTDDLSAVRAAVEDGRVVLLRVLERGSLRFDRVKHELVEAVREGGGDIVQWGDDPTLLVTPPGVDVPREPLTE